VLHALLKKKFGPANCRAKFALSKVLITAMQEERAALHLQRHLRIGIAQDLTIDDQGLIVVASGLSS
jgi:hypothetical protein